MILKIFTLIKLLLLFLSFVRISIKRLKRFSWLSFTMQYFKATFKSETSHYHVFFLNPSTQKLYNNMKSISFTIVLSQIKICQISNINWNLVIEGYYILILWNKFKSLFEIGTNCYWKIKYPKKPYLKI